MIFSLLFLAWAKGSFAADFVVFYDDKFNPTCTFEVEVARTREMHEKGLMFRRELERERGMLFIFNQELVRTFWMKDTYIPLDIIFLDGGMRVVNVHHQARPLDETAISSVRPARFVLEISAGEAMRCNIKEGQVAYYSGLMEIPPLVPGAR